jgi:mono/diheme cytochrome c family protein
MNASLTPILAVAESAPSSPSNVGVGAVVLGVVLVLLLSWFGYLIFVGRRTKRAEESPANLTPWLSDDELETSRVTRILGAAVIVAAVLGIVIPVYYINESGRQARAEEAFDERDIEEGELWWDKFFCTSCHGPLAGGGGAPYTEARSDLPVSWAAPSLNDVFYRYSEDEMREFIVWGRAGTPMAPAGLEGGGSMTTHEVDQVIEFLRHVEISQGEALAEADGIVDGALSRIVDGDNRVALTLLEQQAERLNIVDAPQALAEQQARLEADPTLPAGVPLDEAVQVVISGPGTCTGETAAMASKPCRAAGVDSDRDGIADDAERALTAIAAIAFDTLTESTVQLVTDDAGNATNQIVSTSNEAYAITFDPESSFTNVSVAGEPIADLEELQKFMSVLDLDILTTTLTAERGETFLANTDARIAFLEDSIAAKRWIPEGVTVDDGAADYSELSRTMGTTVGDAERAVGLFNGYCARCHTAGYQAGVATQQEAGSGAWAPALTDGRSLIQFPDADDQIDFIIKGSEFGVNYGLNGLGSGRMPAFGQILSLEDIELIVAYERSL